MPKGWPLDLLETRECVCYSLHSSFLLSEGIQEMSTSDAIQCKPLEVVVSDRGIERAIKMLKRKLASEGVLRELKMRRHYMKPSVKRRKKQAEAARRRRKRAKMDAAPPPNKG